MHGWSQSSLGDKRAWNVFFTDTVTSSLSLCLYLFFLKWILYRHLSIWPFSNNISSVLSSYMIRSCSPDQRAPPTLQYAPILINTTSLFPTQFIPSVSFLPPHSILIHSSYMHLPSTSILTTVCSTCSLVLQWQQTTDGVEYWMEQRCCVMEAGWMSLDQVRFALHDPIRQTFYVSDCW